MHIERKLKFFAKKLVKLCFDEKNLISIEKVKIVCDYLEKNPPKKTRQFLLYFSNLLENEIKKAQAFIESPEKPSNDQLKALESFFENYYKRDISCVCKQNSDLIGGLQISIADDRWDFSIEQQLNLIKKHFQTF